MGDARFRNISYIVISIFERARPAPAPARPARGQRAWDLGELNLLAVLRQVLRPLISSRFFMRIKYMYMHAERALLPLPFFFGDLSGASSSLSSRSNAVSSDVAGFVPKQDMVRPRTDTRGVSRQHPRPSASRGSHVVGFYLKTRF